MSTVGSSSTKAAKVLHHFFDDEETEEELDDSQLDTFFNSKDKSFDIYKMYPDLLVLFIKYNTTIPSSAPSERLFSAAKHILTSKRPSLTDENFESSLMLKVNCFKKSKKT